MKGNMLSLSGSGSYRSRGDCYYSSQGLDEEITEELSKHSYSPDSILKINYCPFCGRKLESLEYEITDAKRQLETLNKKLEKLHHKLKYKNVFGYFKFKKQDNITNYNKQYDIDEVEELSYKIRYGLDEREEHHIEEHMNTWKYKMPVSLQGSHDGYCYTFLYYFEDETFEKLIEMRIVRKSEKKFQRLLEERKAITDKIQEIEQKIKELKSFIRKKK